MNNYVKSVLAITFSLVAANAAALRTSRILLCASLEVHECVDGVPCAEVRPEEVGAPTFVWIDTRTGRMVGTGAVSQAAIVIFGACTET